MNPLEAVKKFNGRDALQRVRDGKPNTDAEHRVPTRSRLYDEPNFFRPSLKKESKKAKSSGGESRGKRTDNPWRFATA